MISCKFEDGNQALLRHVVVDAIVVKDNQILLVKRTVKLLEGGKWALPGGYMDRDETTAGATKREIMEETGWELADLSLFQINDNPVRRNEDRQNVIFVYICSATKKTGEPDWESDEQKWFDFSGLPDKEQMAFDHADIIELYQKYLLKEFPLPLLGSA